MARLAALAVALVLACPPAVIGACAALLCAPETGQGAHAANVASSHAVQGDGRDHQRHHEHHHEHQGHHGGAPAGHPAHQAATASSSAFDVMTSPDCCTAIGTPAAVAAVASSRLESPGSRASIDAFLPAGVPADRVPVLLRGASPPDRFSSPPQPVAAPLVLRI